MGKNIRRHEEAKKISLVFNFSVMFTIFEGEIFDRNLSFTASESFICESNRNILSDTQGFENKLLMNIFRIFLKDIS